MNQKIKRFPEWILVNRENNKFFASGSLKEMNILSGSLGHPVNLELKLKVNGIVYDSWDHYIREGQEGDAV